MTRRLIALGLIASALALTACGSLASCSSAGAHPTAGHTRTVHKQPTTPTPTTSTTPKPVFTPDPYWMTPIGQVYTQGDSYTDSGPQQFAEGASITNAQGMFVAYRAAPGDVFTVVAARFGMQWPQLASLNCLRRDESKPWASLYPGDIINLDPHTALSVGTQEGHIYTPTDDERTKCLDSLPPQH